MTIQLDELIGTEQFSYGCNTSTGSRQFLLYEEDPDKGFPLHTALNYLKTNLDLGSLWEGIGAWSVTDVSLEADDSRKESYRVTANYRYGVACDSSPWMIGPVSQNVTARSEMLDSWRANPMPPSEATPRGASEGADVGGVSIDSGKTPVTVTLPLLDLTLVEQFTEPPNFLQLAQWIGTRNSKGWANGAGPGTLLYRGSTSAKNGGLYRITHNFTMDPMLHHCRQVAIDDPSTGDVATAESDKATTDGDGNPSKTYAGSAKKVVWVQHYPRLVDFAMIPFADFFGVRPSPMWPNGHMSPADYFGNGSS